MKYKKIESVLKLILFIGFIVTAILYTVLGFNYYILGVSIGLIVVVIIWFFFYLLYQVTDGAMVKYNNMMKELKKENKTIKLDLKKSTKKLLFGYRLTYLLFIFIIVFGIVFNFYIIVNDTTYNDRAYSFIALSLMFILLLLRTYLGDLYFKRVVDNKEYSIIDKLEEIKN